MAKIVTQAAGVGEFGDVVGGVVGLVAPVADPRSPVIVATFWAIPIN